MWESKKTIYHPVQIIMVNHLSSTLKYQYFSFNSKKQIKRKQSVQKTGEIFSPKQQQTFVYFFILNTVSDFHPSRKFSTAKASRTFPLNRSDCLKLRFSLAGNQKLLSSRDPEFSFLFHYILLYFQSASSQEKSGNSLFQERKGTFHFVGRQTNAKLQKSIFLEIRLFTFDLIEN